MSYKNVDIYSFSSISTITPSSSNAIPTNENSMKLSLFI